MTEKSSFLWKMQQYFARQEIQSGMDYLLSPEQAHHAEHVLHLDQETVRIVHDGKAWFGTIEKTHAGMVVHVQEPDPVSRELPCRITLAAALIRRERLELVLQKAAELGAGRIVVFESSRCVVHARQEKLSRQRQRWQSILEEASAQCRRDRIPELCGVVSLADLSAYQEEQNLVAYEEAGTAAPLLSEVYQNRSALIVIGPEGGFSRQKIAQLRQQDFACVTLGRRILRAETASLYALSVLAERQEGQR